ncbi:MAG: hypothetical protein P0Y64_04655 [Candidatus Sphingomonas colombiensis]|nr:hypothetical protein [Sphingomonas sp.]WEK44123.1 MAG: hypothetical protein P0Y64_04655 [Sphingomonas sp.]
MPSRLLVGNSVRWEMIAFHRDFRGARQVACVRVRGNDGTTQTSWQTVAATVISTLCEDTNPIEVYAGGLDVTALATGAFWLEAEVYPWIGAAPSVLKSEDLWAASASPREFTRRYYHKDVALAAAPPLAYVKAGGSDTAGVWSVNAATALATPFATVAGACSAITNVTRGTPSKTGTGARIRIVDNTANNAGTNGTSFPQGGAGIVIERAPGVARASAVLNLAGNLRVGLTCSVAGLEPHMTLSDVSVGRSVNTQKFYGEAGAAIGVQFWNVAINDTAGSSPWANAHASFFGASFATSYIWLSLNTGLQIRMTRGVAADLNNGAIESWVVIGCTLQQIGSQGATDPTKGAISYGNRLLKMRAIAPGFALSAASAGDRITGVVIVQNLFEVIGGHANASVGLSLSADNANGDVWHAVVAHNTLTGFAGTGRNNWFYNESQSPGLTNRRTHKLLRSVGNIWTQLNVKGDIFLGGNGNGTPQPGEAANRTGNFAYLHGVGCQGEFSQFCSADGAQAGSSFSQLYPGIGAAIGTSLTTRSDPLFVDYQAMTGVSSYGVGGGDYRLKPESPARNRVTAHGLAFDLDGAARPSGRADAAGAYS